MKTKLAVAMAITAGLCFAGGGVTPVFAGHWTVAENKYGYYQSPGSANYAEWKAENHKRQQGTTTQSFTANGQAITNSVEWDTCTIDGYCSGFGPPQEIGVITDPGTTGSNETTGKRRLIFHWNRNGSNDDPPAVLHLQVYLFAAAYQYAEDESEEDDMSNVTVETSVGIENVATYVGDYEHPSTYPGFPASYLSVVNKKVPVSVSTNNIDQDDNVASPWFTFHAKAQGDVFSSVSSYVWQDVNLMFMYEIDNRAVEISSSVAPSYYKDGNGNRQAHTRDANGHLTADVAATWNEALNMWYWNGSFDANLSGSPWDSPTYTWAGSLLQYNQDNQNPGDVSSINNAQYILPSYTEAAGPGEAPLSLAVSAEDTDGRYLVGTYSINFHKPYDWTWTDESLSDENDAPDGPFDISLSSGPVAVGTQLKYNLDQKKVNFKWGTALQVGSATLTTTGAAVFFFPGGQPASAGLALAGAVMGTAGTIVSALPAVPDTDVSSDYTSYAKYKDAVLKAKAGNNTYPNSNRLYYDLGSIPGGYTAPAYLAYLESNFQQNSTGQNDIRYEGHTTLTGNAHFVPSKSSWESDEYGSNGFVSHVFGHSYHPDHVPAIEITWGAN